MFNEFAEIAMITELHTYQSAKKKIPTSQKKALGWAKNKLNSIYKKPRDNFDHCIAYLNTNPFPNVQFECINPSPLPH